MSVARATSANYSNGVTAALCARAAALRYEDLSAAARTVAGHCLLDWLGVTLGARNEGLVSALIEQAREDGGASAATVIGRDVRLSLPQAAWINSAMSHLLDFDDVHFAMQGHPSSVIAPAAIVLAEYHGAPGRRLIQAFVAGFEMACRVGRLMGPSHYDDGWHSTATVGALGAAAAAANFLRLDSQQTAHALGIAGAQAAGLKCVFGTMTKSLQVGRAAACGVDAARLAARGVTSNVAILDVPQGFATTQSRTLHPAAALEDVPGGFHIPQTLFKYHAACYLTHSSIEAAIALRKQHNLRVEHVTRVVVRVDQDHLSVCNILAPRTGLEMKFSLRATAALALLGEDTSRADLYVDSTASRPDLVTLRDRVDVEARPSRGSAMSEVIIHTADGRELRECRDVSIPQTDLTAQGEKLRRKFLGLTEPMLGKAAAAELAGLCSRIDQLDDVSALIARAAGSQRCGGQKHE